MLEIKRFYDKETKSKPEKKSYDFHNKSEHYQHSGFMFIFEEKTPLWWQQTYKEKVMLIQNKTAEQNL